ncbi:MAG: hypothetical protein WBB19_13290 [Desulforhopalus sp.]
MSHSQSPPGTTTTYQIEYILVRNFDFNDPAEFGDLFILSHLPAIKDLDQ